PRANRGAPRSLLLRNLQLHAGSQRLSVAEQRGVGFVNFAPAFGRAVVVAREVLEGVAGLHDVRPTFPRGWRGLRRAASTAGAQLGRGSRRAREIERAGARRGRLARSRERRSAGGTALREHGAELGAH